MSEERRMNVHEKREILFAIVQGIIALSVVFTILIISLNKGEVIFLLSMMTGRVIRFYF